MPSICLEEPNSLLTPPNVESYNLINLEPWTTYRVRKIKIEQKKSIFIFHLKLKCFRYFRSVSQS